MDITGLEEYLNKHQSDRFKVLRTGGNHGDHLIYEGLARILERVGVEYEVTNVYGTFETRHINTIQQIGFGIRRSIEALQSVLDQQWYNRLDLEEYDHVLIEGGGSMNDLWLHGGYLLQSLCRLSDIPIVVAPQTYFFLQRDFGEILSPATVPVTLFAREEYSLAHIERFDIPPTVTVSLSPDTAFDLEPEQLSDATAETPNEPYTLLSFRHDLEGVVTETRQETIRQQATNPVVSDASRADSFDEFVSLVRDANQIVTDRLHVGILASIFGIETTLFENSYYKTRGVYEYSMADTDCISFLNAIPSKEDHTEIDVFSS